MIIDESGNSAKVTIKDVYQSNDVIHIIDSVLLSKSWSGVLQVNKGEPLFAALFILVLRPMKIKPVYFIPAVIWFIIANILFLMPGPDVPEVSFLDEIYFDKWVHAGLFCGLVFLAFYPFIKTMRYSKKLLIKISIAFILYGVLIEFLQKYVAFERDFDITDIIADSIGCWLGYIASNWLQRKLSKKNKPL